MKKIFWIIALLISSTINMQAQNSNTISIAFYNCENYFDTINDPAVKDEEFLPGAELHWDSKRYELKKQHIARVIASINKSGADIIGLCEIENKLVLDELIKDPQIVNQDYQIVHYNSADERGIDVALLYKKSAMKLLSSKSYRINFPFDVNLKTRDILVVNAEFNNGQQAFIAVNHFPSRRLGTEESEIKRIYVAETERKILDSAFTANKKNNPVLIAVGDFNDEPENKSLKTLEASKVMPLVNTFTALKEKQEGTHYYKGEWSMFDQIFVSKNAMDKKAIKATYKTNSATIHKPEFLLEQKQGKYFGSPLRTYAGPRYFGGYSDHVPVYILMELK
jgi:predicted extracellular nuclease